MGTNHVYPKPHTSASSFSIVVQNHKQNYARAEELKLTSFLVSLLFVVSEGKEHIWALWSAALLCG